MNVAYPILAVGSLFVFTLSGCSGDGTAAPAGNAPTLLADVQPILSLNCASAGCHGGTAPQQNLTLGTGLSRNATVNVASQQLPAMSLITPGQTASSYLIHKINGTHLGAGGSGDRMPPGGGSLATADIDTIRRWVEAGALDN